MQEDEYDKMRAVEDDYWWYRVLRGLVVEDVTRTLPRNGRLLDAGCGTGGMMMALRDFDVCGIDASPIAVAHCHQRGLPQVEVAKVESLPFPDHHFDAVLSLDVLYHAAVDQDLALLEMHRVLVPGGRLIVNLPSFEGLRGNHDVAVSGARRYRAEQLLGLLTSHGFSGVDIHYWNAWLFPLLWIWRRFSRRLGGAQCASDLRVLPESVNELIARIGRVDARVCRRMGVPFGSSLFAASCSG